MVFVLGMQIRRLYQNFPLTLSYFIIFCSAWCEKITIDLNNLILFIQEIFSVAGMFSSQRNIDMSLDSY